MKKTTLIIFFLCFFGANAVAQGSSDKKIVHKVDYRGQLSGWAQLSPDVAQPLWLGGRYIPQLSYEAAFRNDRKFDFEASVNIFGDIGIKPFSDADVSGRMKPYRAWMRYSTKQAEVRLGLQKINFGSAQMLRPLMWFDTMDARDPLQLTDGVWGGLFRYYFKNNANIWLWSLYGNDTVKGWETAASYRFPEFGGRVQLPVKRGEVALSGHFRKADYAGAGLIGDYRNVPEGKIGFDIRLDRVIGMWLEGSWTHSGKNLGQLTNQAMFTLGGDYTIGIGNGIGVTFEQMLYSYDEKAFRFGNATTFSGLMLSYPAGLFDDLSAMIYYDWTNRKIYNFLNWRHNFKHLDLHAILYWNPDNSVIPGQVGINRFQGKGVQIMLVWNH